VAEGYDIIIVGSGAGGGTLYQVHGRHGEDPAEGAWSADYLWPPVDHEPVIRVGEQLAARLGCPVASQMARPGTGPRPAEPRTRPVAVSGVS
jgi:hypothetical protein